MIHPEKNNPELELAWNFVEKTGRHIFLTGKAGTGKTTFLRRVKNESLKRCIVVAPTGVAAINAQGVTIHSFFQLPFGPLIPGETGLHRTGSYKMKFSRKKIDIIRSLDLLIIDEISMVRADLLDGIDRVLRRYKDKNKVFGGVQLLMIGDLQQLAPVVKNNEWDLLKNHYQNPFFFSSQSYRSADVINIELRHIYRQENPEFIKILNEVRQNILSENSIKTLNKRYLPDFTPHPDEGYITLTTHNNKAHAINRQELDKLPGKAFIYDAVVKGKFNEHNYPTHDELTLKVGAQVMFVKNDSSFEKRYYNGKIGRVVHLDEAEVIVSCPGDDTSIVTTPETWENIKYSIHHETKAIEEEKIGSFTQIPLRLAWAITIHKSQGLTFEKAIIDAGASFAHGQTYVALSRCRTLEGMVLKSKITSQRIIKDIRVSDFSRDMTENQPDTETLQNAQKQYQLRLLEELFSFQPFLYPLKRCLDIYYKNRNSIEGNTLEPLLEIKEKGVQELLKIAQNFKVQLQQMSQNTGQPETDENIRQRIQKGIAYFIRHSETYIQKPLEALSFRTENKEVEKNLEKNLQQIDELTTSKLFCFNGLKDVYSGQKYLQLRAKATLQNPVPKAKKNTYEDTTEHPGLFESLRSLRSIISQSEDIPPFQVFTQQSLYEM